MVILSRCHCARSQHCSCTIYHGTSIPITVATSTAILHQLTELTPHRSSSSPNISCPSSQACPPASPMRSFYYRRWAYLLHSPGYSFSSSRSSLRSDSPLPSILRRVHLSVMKTDRERCRAVDGFFLEMESERLWKDGTKERRLLSNVSSSSA